ncbi:small serum protein 2-like [Rhinoderma darwinii]|uniref:small serum protein 2-like n=1 Tax=Rhinoderma darwinii TaxID=43563 RepID=UPI003F677C2A
MASLVYASVIPSAFIRSIRHGNGAQGSLVAFLLVYSFLESLCNGACMDREARLSNSGEKPDGCMDGDIKRDLNSSWFNAECMSCTCDSDGQIDCCSRSLKPLPTNPACEAILDQTSCTYIFKRNDNSSEPCHSWALM